MCVCRLALQTRPYRQIPKPRLVVCGGRCPCPVFRIGPVSLSVKSNLSFSEVEDGNVKKWFGGNGRRTPFSLCLSLSVDFMGKILKWMALQLSHC